ncbi:unnamed protein product [Dovyalis caffra]|uniref:Uncharacterized protein n=1 Tax=Dovyalis caffra TaxID=77055 RepID=A0AAV1RBE0_9ROSI|nr:unnamed protein product [Dovyalis caffra]
MKTKKIFRDQPKNSEWFRGVEIGGGSEVLRELQQVTSLSEGDAGVGLIATKGSGRVAIGGRGAILWLGGGAYCGAAGYGGDGWLMVSIGLS